MKSRFTPFVSLLPLVLLGLACGARASAPPPPPSDKPPPVIADAKKLADEGCTCPDAPCLENAHAAMAKLVEQSGGIDDLPPEAYASQRKLDTCFRDRTKDVARDVDLAAKALCACTDTRCAKSALLDIERLEDKYHDDPIPPDAQAKVAASKKELEGCVTEKIADGRILVPKLEAIADAMCACKSGGCTNAVFAQFGDASKSVLIVKHSGDTEARMNRANQRVCQCGVKAGLKAVLPPWASPDMMSVDCNVSMGGG